MNVEQRKLLLIGYIEHFKTEIMDTSGKYGLDIIMEDFKKMIIQTQKEFQEKY